MKSGKLENPEPENVVIALPVSLQRAIDHCLYCNGTNIIRRGKRKKKNESVQLYFCHHCQRTFTGQITKGKSFPTSVILDGLSYYHVGFSAEEACGFLKKQYGLSVASTTLLRWSQEFADLCPYSRLREWGLRLFSPHQVIAHSRMQHRQTYHFRYHRAKIALMLDDRKHAHFGPIRELLDSVITDCPHAVFQTGSRASQTKNIFSREGVRIVEKDNTAVKLARLALQAVTDNHRRHDTLQKFMIANDSVTVATEIPVVLEPEDIQHFRDDLKFEIPSELQGVVTGHIDLLQIRNGSIHILDYKPGARKVDALDQLTLYALALSRLTGLKLYDFKCAWFDDEVYYEFFPLHVVMKKKRNSKRRRRKERDAWDEREQSSNSADSPDSPDSSEELLIRKGA